MMIALIRAGSLTRLSLSAIGLCWPASASVPVSATVHPWKSRSPLSSSMKTAGQLSPSVSGSIAMNRSGMACSSHRRVALACALSESPDRAGKVKGRGTAPGEVPDVAFVRPFVHVHTPRAYAYRPPHAPWTWTNARQASGNAGNLTVLLHGDIGSRLPRA